MRTKLIKKNVFWSVAFQLTSIICGIIIPRVILEVFGSETNGLISSINQFLNYVALFEGGVSGVAIAALYKPLQERNTDAISKVVNTIQQYFLKLGFLSIIFTFAVALIYPLFSKANLDYWSVFFLGIILGTRLVFQYALCLTYRLLLRADQKVYYVSIVQIIISLTHLILLVVSAKTSHNIIIAYSVSGIIYLIQPVFYYTYVRKHYTIEKSLGVDNNTLAQKWDGFGQNIAYFIHANTDIVLITLFSTLTDVSIYSIYLMIASALQGFVSTVSTAISPSFGNVLAKGEQEESSTAFSRYEFVIELMAFTLYTSGIILIVPFVSVYTLSITDANYIQPLFGTILLLAEMVYCIRDPYINVAYAAGHFKQTSKYAYLEAGLNISISIILIKILGLVGVAAGTLISMSVRAILHIRYLKKHILFRDSKLFYKKAIIYGITSIILISIAKTIIPQHMDNIGQWIIYATAVFLFVLLSYILVNYIFYKRDFMTLTINTLGKQIKYVNKEETFSLKKEKDKKS